MTVLMSEDLECLSCLNGDLPLGCQHCREGGKLVLLITGSCGGGCWYCPLSDAKKGKDVIYANERLAGSKEDVLEEARSIGATGTGITGGDPLQCLERTERAIRALKEEFGEGHHIHLYTCTVDAEKALRLEAAGLDEIRFHPHLDDWDSLGGLPLKELMSRTSMHVGLELPALPGKERELRSAMGSAAAMGLHFVNINELEFSEGNYGMMKAMGYGIKDELSSAVEGSEELGRSLCHDMEGITVHYCSSSFKDSVQLRRRLMRRAERVASESDEMTEDGTLLKGVVDCNEPQKLMEWLTEEFDVPAELMRHDTEKRRLEVAPWVLEDIHEEIPYNCYIVEEYPTSDRLEVERMPLR